MEHNALVVVRGGGDIATGSIWKLRQCGFRVLVLETAHPTAIRRTVAFSEAVYHGRQTVEGMTCRLAKDLPEAQRLLASEGLAMLVDPMGTCIPQVQPLAVVDAILAKRNLGTHRGMSAITVALGPGFTAGVDCDAVIETKRGHRLGRVIYDGQAEPNTGVPGVIQGYGRERVIHSPAAGILRSCRGITDIVRKGDLLAEVEAPEGRVPVPATMDGLLRGMLPEGFPVTKGLKMADIDPRIQEHDNCFTISDKARCIAGGVLEAILHLSEEHKEEQAYGAHCETEVSGGVHQRGADRAGVRG